MLSLKQGELHLETVPLRSVEQFREAARQRPSRQLSEELAAISQVRLGLVMGELPAPGTAETQAEALLLGWSETLKRRVARLKRS